MKIDDMTLDLKQSVTIEADLEKVFASVLNRLGEGNMLGENNSMQMHLEEWAGGRWFRDRGNGIQHLWGIVQVIKPPVLIEISGPLFMSYPALNHLEIKLEPLEDLTKVTLRHRAIGMIDPEHRDGVHDGWSQLLSSITGDFVDSH